MRGNVRKEGREGINIQHCISKPEGKKGEKRGKRDEANGREN